MTDQTINGAVEFRPSLAMRIWMALGFRYGAYIPPPDDDEAIYTTHRVFTHWDWRDRLRILVSGQTETELRVETEKLEPLKGVRQTAVVLAPGLRFESGARR